MLPQSPYSIDISGESLPIVNGHLKLGGTNPQGSTIEVTNYYLLQDGKIVIPVMGEFHFSRYPAAFWEDELLKMKAGGINIVATYVFWIHVEEDEGVFNWSANNDLRRFIELCDKHGLQTLVRIGPFAHGECRNGGLPDWLYGRAFRVRSNDEGYLRYVERLYGAIAGQLEGLLFKDGGSIIGIQLDNEYMHCGAPWEVTFRQGMEWVPAGFEGADHMVKLKQLALKAGLEAPLYTCTGWRNSPIIDGETLPMQGGYVFTPWSPDPDYRQAPTREFIFRNRHLDPVLNAKATYDPANYPYVCCEIGGGIQDTYYHRPIVPPESVEALAVMNLAGGSNLIGYYMYHGGTNPVGKHAFMNEYTVPRLSYDFQAPLREFGQMADSYRCLRLLHMFLHDFGDMLAPMSVVLPENASTITPEDNTHLRYALRCKDGAGFIFLNNYQDHVVTQDIGDIRFQLQTADGTISLPQNQSLVLRKNVTAILPFGLSLEGVALKYATTQLFTRIEDGDSLSYFFFAPEGMVSEYAFDAASYQSLHVEKGAVLEAEGCTLVTVTPGLDAVITLTCADGKTFRLFTLTRKQAEQCSKQNVWGRERLVLSEAGIAADGDAVYWYSTGQVAINLLVYPPMEEAISTPYGTLNGSDEGFFTRFTGSIPQKAVHFEQETIEAGKVVLKFPPDLFEDIYNVLLRIEYVGDVGNAYVDGRLIHDNFYNGSVWEMGLKHFENDLPHKDMLLLVTPIARGSSSIRYVPTGMAFRPNTDQQSVSLIQSIAAVPVYKIRLEQV